MAAEDAPEVEPEQALHEVRSVERDMGYGATDGKMGEADGRLCGIEALGVQPFERGCGDGGFVVPGTHGGVQAEELPAGVFKPVIPLAGKRGIVVFGGGVRIGMVVVARDGVDGDLEAGKDFANGEELIALAGVGEVAAEEAKGGIGSAGAHLFDHAGEPGAAGVGVVVEIVGGDETEAGGFL